MIGSEEVRLGIMQKNSRTHDFIRNHQWDGHGSGANEISGDLGFHPPLDRKARGLFIMPTGLSHRAVIEVPLPEWGDDA